MKKIKGPPLKVNKDSLMANSRRIKNKKTACHTLSRREIQSQVFIRYGFAKPALLTDHLWLPTAAIVINA